MDLPSICHFESHTVGSFQLYKYSFLHLFVVCELSASAWKSFNPSHIPLWGFLFGFNCLLSARLLIKNLKPVLQFHLCCKCLSLLIVILFHSSSTTVFSLSSAFTYCSSTSRVSIVCCCCCSMVLSRYTSSFLIALSVATHCPSSLTFSSNSANSLQLLHEYTVLHSGTKTNISRTLRSQLMCLSSLHITC